MYRLYTALKLVSACQQARPADSQKWALAASTLSAASRGGCAVNVIEVPDIFVE